MTTYVETNLSYSMIYQNEVQHELPSSLKNFFSRAFYKHLVITELHTSLALHLKPPIWDKGWDLERWPEFRSPDPGERQVGMAALL